MTDRTMRRPPRALVRLLALVGACALCMSAADAHASGSRDPGLQGYWKVTGVVTGGTNQLYANGTHMERAWLFYRKCRSGSCSLWMVRSSTSGPLEATITRDGSGWRAKFPSYGLLTCGTASRPIKAHLSSTWSIALSAQGSRVTAVEQVVAPPVCGGAWSTIRWVARPGGASRNT